MVRFFSYLKFISGVLLFASIANAQTILTSSPTLTGTTTPLVLNIAKYNQFPITLTANTPIKFDTPTITGLLQFRLKLCENAVGGFTPVFSAVRAGITIVNNVTNAIQKTTANYCEIQNWTFNSPSNQVLLETVSPPSVTGSGAVPINSAPAQTGNYNYQGFGGNNVACPGTSGDILVQGCNVSALAGTFTGAVTTPAVQATNEISLANNTVSIGSSANTVNLNNSTVVSQGALTATAYATNPANAPNWMGGNENCTSTYHSVTVVSNSTLTLSCPASLTTPLYQITYDFYQPVTGSVFTYAFAAANGAMIVYPLGGGLPAPCASNGCVDRIQIVWTPARNTYSVQFVQTFAALSTNTPSTCPVGQTCKFFAAAGSDSNGPTCAQATPCLTVAKAMTFLSSLSPGDELLFNGGDTWTAQQFTIGDVAGHFVNGSAAKPVIIGSYGTGQPIFDENNVNNSCFEASTNSANAVTNLTIDNFECKHNRLKAVDFDTNTANVYKGITVQRMYIHDAGFGCATSNGACVGSDDGGYSNQIDMEDDSSGGGTPSTDAFRVLNNIVKWTGGHNCIQVHYDFGAGVVQGNVVGPGCVHGFIDVKGSGSTGNQFVIKANTVIGGVAAALCPAGGCTAAFYTENQTNATTNMMWVNNLVYDHNGLIMQACLGGASAGKSTGGTYKFYNNTLYGRSLLNNLAYFSNTTCNGTNTGTFAGYTLDVQNNIFDGSSNSFNTLVINGGGGANAYSVACTENFNNIGGQAGAATPTANYFSCNAAPLNTGAGANDQLNIDPLYVNAAIGSFQLQAGSPEINAGNPAVGTGNPNIGAF